MQNKFIGEAKRFDHIEANTIKDGKIRKGKEFVKERDAMFEKNMNVKAEMVTELIDMGLSLDAIERILHLEEKVLDKLL